MLKMRCAVATVVMRIYTASAIAAPEVRPRLPLTSRLITEPQCLITGFLVVQKTRRGSWHRWPVLDWLINEANY